MLAECREGISLLDGEAGGLERGGMLETWILCKGSFVLGRERGEE